MLKLVANRRALAVLLTLAACGGMAAPVDLLPGALIVRTGKEDPPASYIEVGSVEAIHGRGCGAAGSTGNYEGAYTILRNKASRIGATYVRIDKITEPKSETGCYDNRFIVRGTAYRGSP